MKLINKLIYGSTLFTLTLSGCSNGGLTISNKSFSNFAITEVSVDNGFYGSESGFIGDNLDELSDKIKSKFTMDGVIKVGSDPIKGFFYNGKAVTVYGVNERNDDKTSSDGYFVIQGSNSSEFIFLRNKSNTPGELENYYIALGYSSRSHTSTSGGTYVISYDTNAEFSAVTFNAEERTLSTSMKVTEVKSLNGEETSKSGSFKITLKA